MFEKLTDKNKKIVLWGIGHNSKNPKHYNKVSHYSVYIPKFGLVVTRHVHGTGDKLVISIIKIQFIFLRF